MTNQTLPTYFLTHGGGPWPWMKDDMPGVYDKLDHFLKDLPTRLPEKPKAILVISAHWEEAEFSIMASPHPRMTYDFGGFPSHTYTIKYPAPGDPVLALKIQQLLVSSGIEAKLDADRGFDHGTYSILYPMYPNADIPVLQLSLKIGYDPRLHIMVGRALAPLRKEGVLIIGSGSSFHDLRMPKTAKENSMLFDNWLLDTLIKSTGDERNDRLADWSKAPAARAIHPSEDHLIPLMIAVGAAESEPGSLVYSEMFMGRFMLSSLRFA